MKKRIVPDWMKDFKVEINANTKDESTLKNAQQPDLLNAQLRNTDNNMPQTRSQRSKNFPLNIENEIQHTRVLRSNSVKLTTDSKPPRAPSFPYIEYKGKIIYLTDSIDIACTCDEIINWVEKQDSQVVPIAFDMEWPFSFQTGPGKTALIQICYDLDVCYLFHLPQIKKIPAALYALLAHRKVRLHGVNIKNDFRKLHRDFPEVNEAPLIEQCIDLGPWCNDVCNTGGRWSMERLVLYICKLQINKDKKVRMSKWHVMPLDDNQKKYAAIDVYISQVIYKELERREKLKAAREAEVLELHGEQSLKALKTLDVNFSLENV